MSVNEAGCQVSRVEVSGVGQTKPPRRPEYQSQILGNDRLRTIPTFEPAVVLRPWRSSRPGGLVLTDT
jgi:hypothetical protein